MAAGALIVKEAGGTVMSPKGGKHLMHNGKWGYNSRPIKLRNWKTIFRQPYQFLFNSIKKQLAYYYQKNIFLSIFNVQCTTESEDA